MYFLRTGHQGIDKPQLSHELFKVLESFAWFHVIPVSYTTFAKAGALETHYEYDRSPTSKLVPEISDLEISRADERVVTVP